MKNAPLAWFMVTVTLGAFGVMLWHMRQEQNEIGRMTEAMYLATRPTISPHPILPPPVSNIVASQMMVIRGDRYQFTHRCHGQISTTHFETIEPMAVCVGDYELDAMNLENGSSTILVAGTASTTEDAPVFMGVERTAGPDRASSQVVVSFAPDACRTSNDCGAGMSYHFQTIVFDASQGSVRLLHNVPGSGRFFWNASGSRALIFPDSCGGAGCQLEAIQGYQLANDAVTEVTLEKGAGSFSESGACQIDASGDKMPTWKSLRWTDDEHFEAQLLLPSGETKKINGTFK